MPEPATTAPPAQDSPPSKRNNERKITPEYYDKVWELREQGLLLKDIAAELEAMGCPCSLDSVRRTLKWLGNQRQAAEQAASLREEAIRKSGETLVMRDRIVDELDEIDEHIFEAWEEGDDEKVIAHARAARALRSSLREHNRTLADARKALEKAEELAAKAEQEAWRRDHQASRTQTRKPDYNHRAPQPPAAGAPPASNGTATREDELEDVDCEAPEAPVATFTCPEDGAVLHQEPEAYTGRCEPNSRVHVIVDEEHVFPFIPVDANGEWRIAGPQRPQLAPGQHQAVVASVTPDDRLGREAVVRFTLLTLLFVLLPLSAFANEASLSVNTRIYPPCGLVRPSFAFLADPPSGDFPPPDLAERPHQRTPPPPLETPPRHVEGGESSALRGSTPGLLARARGGPP